MWLGIAILTLVLLFWVILDTKKPKNFPPGPRWWPVFGNLFFVRDLIKSAGSHHLAWRTLAEKYGAVCGLKMRLAHPLVIVSGKATVSEVLANEDLDGRPNSSTSQFRTMGKRRGVLTTDGKEWVEHRHFLINNMANFVFLKSGTESTLLEEAQSCVNKLRIAGGQNNIKGVPMHQTFMVPVLNILWKWISGVKFEDDQPARVKFLEKSKEFLQIPVEPDGILNYFPELRFISPKGTGYSLFAKVHIQIWALLSEMVWEHKHNANEEHSQSLVDIYLKELKTPDKMQSSCFTDMQLVALIKDIIGTGSESTSSTIKLAIFLMVIHQKIQVKVQKEIDDVIGKDRSVLLSDQTRLPYVTAVLMETQRISTVSACTLPHRALKDTQISGYDIPEDTTVLLNLWSVHMNKEHWIDPEIFRPERFLDDSGRIKEDSWLIPFGQGRRRCLGEGLAKDTIFVFFAVCLQQLTFTLPPSTECPSYSLPTSVDDITDMSEHFNVNISSRGGKLC